MKKFLKRILHIIFCYYKWSDPFEGETIYTDFNGNVLNKISHTKQKAVCEICNKVRVRVIPVEDN